MLVSVTLLEFENVANVNSWGDRCASIGTGWPMTIDEQDVSYAGHMILSPQVQLPLYKHIQSFPVLYRLY